MTVIAFLHGVGGTPQPWVEGLELSTSLNGVATGQIEYFDLLDPSRSFGKVPLHPLPIYESASALDQASGSSSRAGYARRQGDLRRIANHAPDAISPPSKLPPRVIPQDALVRLRALSMRQAGLYRHDELARIAVLDRVESQLNDLHNEHGGEDIVLLAHSFGSVIALDLLHSRSVRVGLMVSFGSPLGLSDFWAKQWQGNSQFPYGRVGGWLNVTNIYDPIPLQRGISKRFPQAVDAFIRSGDGFSGPRGYHDPRTYLSSQVVGQAIANFREMPG